MTTTSAGTIAMTNVRSALNVAYDSAGHTNYPSSTISFNDTMVRRLINGSTTAASNPISMSSMRNKAGPEPWSTTTGQSSYCVGSTLKVTRNNGQYGTYADDVLNSTSCVPIPLPVDVLIVGGGGGGHSRYGSDNNAMNGGAGAGGMVEASFSLPQGTYSFTIGVAGYQSNGGNTSAFGYTAYGGGMGGGSDGQAGFNGGSGGGGAGTQGGHAHSGVSIQPKPTSGNYGNMPAYGNDGGYYSGSGGGAGGQGSGSTGGAGRAWPINGVYYAGGGGNSYSGAGGIGGGGTGPGQNATYYGGGGSGSNSRNGGLDATYGYQGIVIISYVWATQLIAGGSVTTTGSGAGTRWYHYITDSSQTITF